MSKFSQFVETIRQLRGPNGCPWDQEQTHQTLKACLIEECYELAEAIDNDDTDNMAEELGDVLLQVVIHAVIAEETKRFSLDAIIQRVNQKMIDRHPHVFGDVKLETSKEVINKWDELKGKKNDIFSGIPTQLPALMKANKIQKKVAKQGFDWPTVLLVFDKLTEELKEVQTELEKPFLDKAKLTEEVGDVLFTAVNMCRKLSIDPEEALNLSNEKFKKRWQIVDQTAKTTDKQIPDMSLDELEQLWKVAKNKAMSL